MPKVLNLQFIKKIKSFMKKNIFAKSETEYPYSIVLQPLGQSTLLCT